MSFNLLDKKTIVDEYLAYEKGCLSSLSFVNIFSWKEFFKFEFEIINNQLCIFASNEIGHFLYLPPLGTGINLKTINDCFRRLNNLNQGSGVSRIENVSQRQLSFFPQEQFSFYKKGYEYIYFKDDIVYLKGNDYKSKRSSFNQFKKNNISEFKEFDIAMTDECMDCYDCWAKKRKKNIADDLYWLMLEENRGVHRITMEKYKQLGLIGRVVLIDGRIKGYTFGYPVNDEVFCVLFEIVDLDVSGLSVFIFQRFCADPALSRFKFINVMDDFELPNIKRTKMSFHPKVMLPSYVVNKKNLKV